MMAEAVFLNVWRAGSHGIETTYHQGKWQAVDEIANEMDGNPDVPPAEYLCTIELRLDGPALLDIASNRNLSAMHSAKKWDFTAAAAEEVRERLRDQKAA